MYKSVAFHGALNDRTGYGIHATNFVRELSKLIPVNVNGEGEVHVSLLDVVTASQTTIRHPYPSILHTVWESTQYPKPFLDNLKLYDQMWVVSEWERSCAIAQGIPEEFVKVVHEGVDPDIYKPGESLLTDTFNFVHVGQWQPRKSTVEICQAFLKAFPKNKKVRLYLSADTLFPSDEYKSTEERLKAYGVEDPRIIPVHFEEREDYIRRLQGADCFVSCSRAEGWGLPFLESMSCGIPTIVADWSGSTEYAFDALKVRISELKKPHGIYGNWDVPGEWGEPDYDHLVEVMKDAYKNYKTHKEQALETAKMIHEKFSWEAAAKKAMEVLTELSVTPENVVAPVENPVDVEKIIAATARKYGYDITGLQKRKVLFTTDSHPSTPERMDTLEETAKQIKALGYPLLIVSHLPVRDSILKIADFFIYDKRDILGWDDMPVYWRTLGDGKVEKAMSSIPCHTLAGIHNIRNIIDFAKGKYDWIYHMSSDAEVDLQEWVDKVHASEKDMVDVNWGGDPKTFGGQLMAGKVELFDKIFPILNTWEEYAALLGEDRFCAEKGFYKIVDEAMGIENVDYINIEVGNRFSQVDYNVWKDDLFQYNFIDGPYLNIVGISEREYDVTYTNPIDGINYRMLQKANMWTRPSKKYFRDWTIRATLNGEQVFEHKLDLKDKNVIISMGSKALGDTLAWIPYVEEFRKKHGCNVYCSTWWNNIMDYPEIHFIMPGDSVPDVYATYTVGCFDDQPDFNPDNWRVTPLQKVAADILGLEYEPIRARLKSTKNKSKKPYVCFSEFSTMKNKLWNRPGAWQDTVDKLKKLGYDCVSISAEKTALNGVISHNGQPIEQTVNDVAGAAFYIGLNAGPTWVAYSLGIPTIMITGVSEPWNDFENPHRISTDDCRPGCFNDPTLQIDRGWEWCPRKKDYICTKNITPAMVMKEVTKIRKGK